MKLHEGGAGAAGGEVTLRAETPADRGFLFSVYAATRDAELEQVPWTDAQKQAFLWQQFEAQAHEYRRADPDGRCSVPAGWAAWTRLAWASEAMPHSTAKSIVDFVILISLPTRCHLVLHGGQHGFDLPEVAIHDL